MHSWPGPALPRLPGTGLALRLYDSAAQEVRPTTPGDTALIYVCGITPYDATHIGHAATYVAFDLVNRVWRDGGHDVHYVQNVTDVDDPLLERAATTGVDWQELAAGQIERFRDDMVGLRVLPPEEYIGVVEAIPLVVARIAELIKSGAAYRVDADWYFEVASDPHFGSVAHLDRAQQLAMFAERGGDPQRPGKRDALDCLLWRAARPGEPSWESEFGPGRPGWHVECAAIALQYLGMGFDIQAGGSDLIFPHHEMCASQAQVATGDWPFARGYAHAGMVGLAGEKMSKSRGNLVFVSELLAGGISPMAIRLALLAHHYRGDWDWDGPDLATAGARLDSWRQAVSRPTGPPAQRLLSQVRTALADDLDTPRALRAIDEWAREQQVRGGTDVTAPGLVSRTADALLGVAL